MNQPTLHRTQAWPDRPAAFPDLMTEAEAIAFLQIPEISKAGNYRNVIENLKRIVPNLVEWTEEPGEDYEELEELYGEVIAQWNRYMGHVANHIGGVYETFKTYDQDGMVYEVTPPEQQAEAMGFLNEFGFQTPDWMLDQDILRRIEGSGALDRIQSLQAGILRQVLSPDRMKRMIEAAATGENNAYTLPDMLTELRTGIWSELEDGETIDPYRRNLQRAHIERIEELLGAGSDDSAAGARTSAQVAQSDIRVYLRGELRRIDEQIDAVLPAIEERATLLHLEDIQTRVEEVLNPEG